MLEEKGYAVTVKNIFSSKNIQELAEKAEEKIAEEIYALKKENNSKEKGGN